MDTNRDDHPNCSNSLVTAVSGRELKTCEQVAAKELTFAASVSHQTSGNSDASKIIKEIMSSPNRAKKYHRIISSSAKQVTVTKFTPQDALAIFVEGYRYFTKRQWEVIQNASKSVYPCYSLIKMAKEECYPDKESIQVSETCAEIQFQALLDYTGLCLYKYIAEVVEMCSEEEKKNMYGFNFQMRL